MTIYAPQSAKKMTAAPRLSAVEKSAVIVAHLLPDQAAMVLRGLRAADLRRFSDALQRVRTLPDATVRGVIGDFLGQLNTAPDIETGVPAMRALLGDMLDAPMLDKILAQADISRINLWAFVAQMSADELGQLLSQEHPQTIAWVLEKLAPQQSRDVLRYLPAELAQQSVLAITHTAHVSPQTGQVIEATLTRKLLGGR